MEDNNSSIFADKKTVETARSNRSSKKTNKEKGASPSKANDMASEDISLSQLEMMANKKKLQKAPMSVTPEKRDTISQKASKDGASSSFGTVSVGSASVRREKQNQEVHAKRENRSDSVRREKCEYLYKLEKLMTKDRGRFKSLGMDMNNTLDEIRNEFTRVSNEIKTERSVSFFKRMLLLGVQGMEMLNTKFDPLGVDLDGWSEAMGYSMEQQEYDEVLAELYEKYKGAAQMSPEVKLMFMIVSSATMFTISKKITKMDSSNAFANIIGNIVGNSKPVGTPQQVFQPPQPSQMYNAVRVPSPDELNAVSDTTEDPRPSKLRDPGDGININNILKTMNDRKKEKELEAEPTDDNFRSVPLLSSKRPRGRPKKMQTAVTKM